jgi:hypothetical protein
MAEEAIKKRTRRAIRAAMECLDNPPGSWDLTILDNHVFHLEAARQREIRKIRIVLDRISARDVELVSRRELPEICTKEIWCRSISGGFSIKKIPN